MKTFCSALLMPTITNYCLSMKILSVIKDAVSYSHLLASLSNAELAEDFSLYSKTFLKIVVCRFFKTTLD
jgi:hypothetical protein